MSFDFSTLITDRTQADVTAGNAKGTYKASDLNRVGAAMNYVADRLRAAGYDPHITPVKLTHSGKTETVTQTVEKQMTTDVTEDNVSSFFAVSNDSYYFKPSGGAWATTNGGVSSSTAKTVFTALKDMTVSFAYSYSSEANYDKFTLKVAGSTVENAVSGSTTNKTYTGTLTAGQTIELTYSKDSSTNSNDDKCTMSALKVTRMETVTETIVVEIPDTRDPYIWYSDDIPFPAYMNLYISNLAELRKQFSMMKSTPEVPPRILATDINSNDGLTYTWANDIEQILKDIDLLITNMTAAWFYSGDPYAGEV